MIFNSIVVAYDGSANAGRALDTASRLAAGEQARLGIIFVINLDHMSLPLEIRNTGDIEHVIEPLPNFMVDLEKTSPDLVKKLARVEADSHRAMLQYADSLLSQALKRARDCGARDVEAKTVQGDPAEMVVEFAREREADLIVCGSRGLGRLKQLLLGSISHKINQLAACSCLTVK
ncbi:universal stress protein [Gammaproteobacteria bacterium]|nr:universal stress protein [Gammaproteobacteria bacterium]